MSTLFAFPASIIPQAHTVIAALAFTTALFMGWAGGLWKDLCDNAVSKWPVEWFPSVSATIGDHAAPRAPFQLFIALCATPRFLLLLVQWLVHRYPPSPHSPGRTLAHSISTGRTSAISDTGARNRAAARAAEVVDELIEPLEQAVKEEEKMGVGKGADVELIVGIIRTFCCGGWVYITSRDHHNLHDFFMILYLLLTPPWMFLSIINSTSIGVRRRRQVAFGGFLVTIPPLLWLYHQHSVLRIPGAYTYYAMFEWSLVIWDVGFDAMAVKEFSHLRLAIVDTNLGKDDALKDIGSSQRVFLAPSSSAQKAVRDDRDFTALVKDGERIGHRALVAWLSDVYLAVCFWTVYTSLGFQLFYWSVWKLALAGPELALLVNLSGYSLASKSGLRYVTSRDGLFIHRGIMVVAGMGCYFIPSPALRLLGISVGTWTGWLAQYGNWTRLKGSAEMLAEGQILGLGLVITLLLKYVNASTNPLWATSSWGSGGWNITGLLIASACLYEYAHRPVELFPAPPISEAKNKPVPPLQSTAMQRWAITIGLGSMIHMIQTFVNDAGTIIAWTWTGYPIKGPTLHPFAGVVITAAALSLTFSFDALSFMWSAVGCAAAYILYSYPDWLGFNGGLILVTYLMSTLPRIIRAASALPPAPTFGNALLVNCVLDVISVVTAAYAFVPCGHLVRERTDLVLGFSMGCIALASWAASRVSLPGPARMYERSKIRVRNTKRWTILGSTIVTVLSLLAGYRHMPTSKPVPYHPDHRIFSGGIWAVHFGVDESGRDSQRRMMELVRDMQVDVLGLLETDLHRFVYGNRDLTRVMVDELGYHVDLGPGPNKHTWGAALLSKFPIINSTHHLLPSPHGELAPAIHATLDVHGEKVNVWVSHNGQEEDALDRELQTTEIARNLRETADVPTVFLGYLVTHPGDLRPWPYQILMEDGMMYDIEIEDRWRWCEYIAFRGLWRIAFARLHESDITDTELQVGKFVLPLPGEKVVYESNEEIYWHIGENDIPEPWRMPRMFWDKGVRGHFYRVWEGPVYYLPPRRSQLQKYGWEWSTKYPDP